MHNRFFALFFALSILAAPSWARHPNWDSYKGSMAYIKSSMSTDALHYHLTDDEILGLHLYQHNHFKAINGALRTGQSTIDPDQVFYLELADAINSALRKLPRHPGRSYRGTLLPYSTYQELLVPGAIFQDRGFLSTSRDPNISVNFSNRHPTPNTEAVFFSIEGYSGRRLLDVFATTYASEEEILFQKGTRFEVLGHTYEENVWIDDYTEVFPRITTIYLRELRP
jgi:hypothetical protein